MDQYEHLYQLYDEYDTDTLRELQAFVDVFPAIDSQTVLEYWNAATRELDRRKDEVRGGFAAGETLAEVAARADREQAFTGLDLASKYGRTVNVLVLDVDETLRSAGQTDNEIPRETLHALTEFHEAGVPMVICTGQTLENVKGFAIQGLGGELVHSGRLSIVYEAGAGVFTPGHGSKTKQLLADELDEPVRGIFESVRGRVLSDAPADLRRGCHLQGNEFNVTLKPNYEIGSSDARSIIDDALVYLLDLLADVVADAIEPGDGTGDGTEENADRPITEWTRRFYGARDPEIRAVLEANASYPDADPDAVPSALADVLERIDVAYYEADAAELSSLDLHKVVGVERALSVLEVEDPFALVMGDSKSDLRVMEWVAENDAGIAAAPDHASREVLEHVLGTDGLVFDRGKSVDALRTVYALNRLNRLP